MNLENQIPAYFRKYLDKYRFSVPKRRYGIEPEKIKGGSLMKTYVIEDGRGQGVGLTRTSDVCKTIQYWRSQHVIDAIGLTAKLELMPIESGFEFLGVTIRCENW